jgi:hypothetical protein
VIHVDSQIHDICLVHVHPVDSILPENLASEVDDPSLAISVNINPERIQWRLINGIPAIAVFLLVPFLDQSIVGDHHEGVVPTNADVDTDTANIGCPFIFVHA